MRNRLILLLLVALTITPRSFSQIPYVDSREVILKGIDMFDKDEHKVALDLFRQVHECDTNYALALYEIINTLLTDSAYAEAKKIALGAVKLKTDRLRDLQLELGHAYDYTNQADSALTIYGMLAKQYPTDHQPYYESGVVYFRQKNYDKAVGFFQKAVIINPNHFRSHYMLGLVYALQGRLSEAMMALEVSLLVTKDATLAKSSIALLSTIAEQTDDVKKAYTEKNEKYSNAIYDEVDQVINAKLSYLAAYKLKIGINDNVFRQSQAMMEKLRFDASDTSFTMQYYAPIFTELYKNDMFEGFMLLAFSDFGVAVVDNLAKRKKDAIDDARNVVFPYINKIQATRELNYNRRKTAKEFYHYLPADEIIILGTIVTEGKESRVQGDVTVYRTNHTLFARGNYNDKSEKTGPWKYYFASGAVMKEEGYKNRNLTGIAKYYYGNGNPEKIVTFDNEGKAIQQDDYSYRGIITQKSKVLSLTEIERTYYNTNGTTQAVMSEIDGKAKDDEYKFYYGNGTVSKVINIKDGKNSGKYVTYYPSGKVNEEGTYDNGELEGPCTEYFENGKVSKKSNFHNGKYDGAYEEYYDNGQLSEVAVFKKNKRTGTDKKYDRSGHLYSEIDMKDFVPLSIKFYDAQNNVVYQKENSHGIYEYSIYFSNGAKAVDTKVDEDGMRDGVITYYYSTGGKSDEISYKNGNKEGSSRSYYKDGKVKTEESYKNDVNDGYFKKYSANGNIEIQGWYKEGKKQGLWKDYYLNGALKTEVYYLSDYINGYSKDYNPKGELMYKYTYDYDVLESVVVYDSMGRAVDSNYYPQGNGHFKLADKQVKGHTEMECELKGGLLNGAYTTKYYTGAVCDRGFFREGKKDSLLIAYHPNGKIKVKGLMSEGARTGKWVFYNEAGELLHEENVLNNMSNGRSYSYSGDILYISYNYKNDEKDGEQIYYGEDKRIACILYYDEGNFTGYSYEGKDGKLLPAVSAKNGTAKIKAYYSNGKVSAEMNIDRGEFSGDQKLYFSNGQLAEERTCKKDLMEGPFKRYNPAGKLVYEVTYVNGEESGIENFYDKEGKLLISKNHFAGIPNGSTIVYDPVINKIPVTNKTQTYTFHCGDLINVEE